MVAGIPRNVHSGGRRGPMTLAARDAVRDWYGSRPLPKFGFVKYGPLFFDCRDHARMISAMAPENTPQFAATQAALKLTWENGSRRPEARIPIDPEGFLLGVDGRRVLEKGKPVNVQFTVNEGPIRIGFFHRALGLDGGIVGSRKRLAGISRFMDEFLGWAKRPNASFPFYAEVPVADDGFVHLPFEGRTLPITTDAIMRSYRGRNVAFVPALLRGQVVGLLFDPATREFLGERDFDYPARLFYFQDTIRAPGKRYYAVPIGSGYEITLGKQTFPVGRSRRRIGEVLRVRTDNERNIEGVTTFLSRSPLVIGEGSKSGWKGIGRSGAIDVMLEEGEGMGRTDVRRYPRGRDKIHPHGAALGINVAGDVKYFTVDDVTEHGIQVGDDVQYRHEGGVVREITVRRYRIPLIVNSVANADGVRPVNSYRAGVPREQLDGTHVLEGLPLVPGSEREQRVAYGRDYFLRMVRPPFDTAVQRMSVIVHDGGDPIYFRDTPRFHADELTLAKIIAARLRGKRYRKPEGGHYDANLLAAEALFQKGEAEFLSTASWESAFALFRDTFILYPRRTEPLVRAVEIQKAIVTRRPYLQYRQKLQTRLRRLLEGEGMEGLSKLTQFLWGEEVNALVMAHLLEIMAGVHSGKYPGEKERAGFALAAFPNLFVVNSERMRRRLVGGMKILSGDPETARIAALLIGAMPANLARVQTRLTGYYGLPRAAEMDGLPALSPTDMWALQGVVREAIASRPATSNGEEHTRFPVQVQERTATLSPRLVRLINGVTTPTWSVTTDNILHKMKMEISSFRELQSRMREGDISAKQAWRELARTLATLQRNWGAIENYARYRVGGELPFLLATLRLIVDEEVFEVQDKLLAVS